MENQKQYSTSITILCAIMYQKGDNKMVIVIYLILWFIALVMCKFNIIVIGLGFIVLLGIAKGIQDFKAKQYLADKYDEERRNNKR